MEVDSSVPRKHRLVLKRSRLLSCRNSMHGGRGKASRARNHKRISSLLNKRISMNTISHSKNISPKKSTVFGRGPSEAEFHAKVKKRFFSHDQKRLFSYHEETYTHGCDQSDSELLQELLILLNCNQIIDFIKYFQRSKEQSILSPSNSDTKAEEFYKKILKSSMKKFKFEKQNTSQRITKTGSVKKRPEIKEPPVVTTYTERKKREEEQEIANRLKEIQKEHQLNFKRKLDLMNTKIDNIEMNYDSLKANRDELALTAVNKQEVDLVQSNRASIEGILTSIDSHDEIFRDLDNYALGPWKTLREFEKSLRQSTQFYILQYSKMDSFYRRQIETIRSKCSFREEAFEQALLQLKLKHRLEIEQYQMERENVESQFTAFIQNGGEDDLNRIMLRNRRNELDSHSTALEVIDELEKVIRNLQIRLKTAQNEQVRFEREATKAIREKDLANNTLGSIRSFKLMYLEHLLTIASKVTKSDNNYTQIFKKSKLDQDTKVVKYFEESNIIDDCVGIAKGYEIMKDFINNMKSELANLGILPPLSIPNPNKFVSQKIIITGKVCRGLYEKWSDPKITEIVYKSAKEYFQKMRGISKRTTMKYGASMASSPDSISQASTFMLKSSTFKAKMSKSKNHKKSANKSNIKKSLAKLSENVIPNASKLSAKYASEISASKEFKDLKFDVYDTDSLSKFCRKHANIKQFEISTSNIIEAFNFINTTILQEVHTNKDRNFEKLSIPVNELVIPVYDERQILTHFELNPTLMKLAYMRDYRNTDTIREGIRLMILLNRVYLHDKTLATQNSDSTGGVDIAYRMKTNKECQTEYNDLIRNFMRRNLLFLKSHIDSIPLESITEQYKDSNDEDLIFMEFRNIQSRVKPDIKSEQTLNEEVNTFSLLTKLFDSLKNRINEIMENEGEISLDSLFDYNKIYKEEKDNVSIFTDEGNDNCFDTERKKIKAKKLKPVLKRALLDLKIKGRIDTGDSILNTFLGFFLNEDPKKIILLVDSFCSLAKNLPKKEMINLHFGSDEISEVSLSSGKSLKEEDREKLISLKLQSIDEVIKRSERMKGRKNLNRKKRQSSKPNSKPRLFNNSVLQKKLANETMSNRLKINKFINKETPRRKVSRKNSVLSVETDDDVNLHKYLFTRKKTLISSPMAKVNLNKTQNFSQRIQKRRSSINTQRSTKL
ncbi:unnamed protein product [Moneuplotes crassus]|uniref:Uncharacterized protein n=1 Tax=Euplotes crassus TaxID=5936 RepID=A0AAD1UHM4_EUPCR|nr:unnamed protein product [Moneuplotes crassus]